MFLLLKHGEIQYRAGDIADSCVSRTDRGDYAVRVINELNTWEGEFHEIIVRHGPVSALSKLYPDISWTSRKSIEGTDRLWPDGFYPRGPWSHRPTRLYSRIEFQEVSSFHVVKAKIETMSDVTLVKTDEDRKAIYVRPLVHNDPDCQAAVRTLLNECEMRYDARYKLDFKQDNDGELVSISEVSAIDRYIPSLDDVLNIVQAPKAWTISKGTGVDIAVIDTGVDGTRPEFSAKNHLAGWAPLNETPWSDWNGHGTMVACIAAASRVAGGSFDGIAPEAGIIPCRTNFYDSELAASYDYLIDLSRKGRRIVAVNSFGVRTGTPPTLLEDSDFYSALEDAINADILIVFSAGNYHELAGGRPDDDFPNSIWLHKSRADVLTVASCDLGGKVLPYSSRGPGQWFGEPGSNFKPDVIAPSPVGGKILYGNEVQDLAEWGSSASAAVVAGLASLILGICPDLPSRAVIDIIRYSARSCGNSPSCEGLGMINCHAALLLAEKISRNSSAPIVNQ